MKKILTICFFLSLMSCSSDIEQQASFNTKAKLEIKSSLSTNTFAKISKEFNSMNINSRSNSDTEFACKKILQPLITDGKTIQNQIILQLDHDISSSNEDKEFIKNLNEEELASLSFLLYHIDILDKNDSTQPSTISTQSVDTKRLRNCLGFAIGVSQIKELSVNGILTATTLRKAIIAIGKRYLGYIGVVLMVADFYDCFYG